MTQDTLRSAAAELLAPATDKTLVSETNLAGRYRRLDLGIRNAGANPVTAAALKTGVGSARVTDPSRSAALLAALSAGGSYALTLTDDDVPDALEIDLTSASGTTLAVYLLGTQHSTTTVAQD